MSLSEAATAVAIYVVVPISGVVLFLLLCLKMSAAQIPSPPYLAWFILFGIFGGWLLVALTALLWMWSGMASIGTVALVLVAPFVTATQAWRLRRRRGLSPFHRAAFGVSLGYSALMLVTILVWIGAQAAR